MKLSHICLTSTIVNVDSSRDEALRLRLIPCLLQVKDSAVPFKHYKKKRKINWQGSTVVFLYCVALCLYLFIRITKTMSLGNYLM